MAAVRLIERSFAGGELSPLMLGRSDDARYQAGLATCRNFKVRPEGPAENRAGFQYVNTAKTPAKRTRVIPFTYSTTQTMVLEFGEGYIRFHTQGATLNVGAVTAWSSVTAYTVGALASLAGVNYYCILAHTNQTPPNATYWYPLTGSIYEIPTPYAEADLFDLHYVQSSDVVTIVHPSYAPRELRRLGATTWTLTTPSFGQSIASPTGVSVAATTAPGTDYNYYYVVTAIAADGVTESAASANTGVANNLFLTGGKNTISWSAVSGASLYNVYKFLGGLYGLIGQVSTLSMVDDNIAPDMSRTPPTWESVFSSAGNYPAAVTYFEQRRWFAGTTNAPQTIWGTRSGTESAMNYSLPIRDDDRIKFKVSAREANTIRHLVPLSQLLPLTSSAEWRVTANNSDAITPSSIVVRPQSYVGASNVQPLIVNNTVLYVADRGGHMREMAYSWQANGFITGDLSLRASHLFDTRDVVDMCYAKAPYPVVWAVSTNGYLLGLTYVPEQQIGGWHWHDTAGTFESCCTVAEGEEDVLYVVTNRTINGAQTRFIERQATRQYTALADAFFVDAGLTYSGAPATVISGLGHLEGATVNILADGAVVAQQAVTGGTVTLPTAASKVTVGLPITADVKTLPVAAQIDGGYGSGRMKNVNKLWLRVFESSGIYAGPDFDHLFPYKQRTTEPFGSPPNRVTAELEMVLTPTWQRDGSVAVRQSDPLPLTITAMAAEVQIAA